ncbi:hypothetical protein [Daejeonella sp.]|jgi:hypothetical protein|uniref:hypothetical protein n=1 Tax=Daejeonella sp. TaxID=2805397 RepID=UPI0037BEB1E1
MKRYFSLLFLLLVLSKNNFGQQSNGRVNSLIAAENYFAAYVKDKGIRDAFLKVSDENTLLYKPNPVKAEAFFDKKSSNDHGKLDWSPSIAKISKSGDWGFTSGSYRYSTNINTPSVHGQYLSVWRTNVKGVWKLALRSEMIHPEPSNEPNLSFVDPKNFRFFRQIAEGRLKQREELILTSDKLFSKTLLDNQRLAYDTFFAEEGRLLFPGYEPIIGKTKVNNFLSRQQIRVETIPSVANRALGSDLAYTYGKALITRDGITKMFYYTRIWESQEGFTWNILLEIYRPAEE